MITLEESFTKYYDKLSESIKGTPAEGEKVNYFRPYADSIIKQTQNLDLIIKNGFDAGHKIVPCKVLSVVEKTDIYGYYFATIELKIGKAKQDRQIIYVGGYPTQPLNMNMDDSEFSWYKVLNSLDGATEEFKAYVNLIDQFNEEVHKALEDNTIPDGQAIADKLMGTEMANARIDTKNKKLEDIKSPHIRYGGRLEEVGDGLGKGIETDITDDKWEELAQIADKYYAPENTVDEEGQYQFFREKKEHWAVTDGDMIFANAATACKYYADGLGLDPAKEIKKGNFLYNACENIDAKGKLSRTPVLMYRTAWRYATGNEIRNAKTEDRKNAAMWGK